ncbi:SPOR domain-containing protein [Nocardioides caricicola]|uniref:SPOR domain-containing protein n=1 Tax=Nocardioides caricicola TaxID=634770 RepID=A0ABW0N9R1_9ACTN
MSAFWYCVKHRRVEDDTNLCPPIDRLGPYATREEAEDALAIAERRNEDWDAQDDDD